MKIAHHFFFPSCLLLWSNVNSQMEPCDQPAPRKIFSVKKKSNDHHMQSTKLCLWSDAPAKIFLCCFVWFSPGLPLSPRHPHTLGVQSPAQGPARPSCSWTQTQLTACDPGFTPAKNSLGLTICVADSSGMEHPEMPGSMWISSQER